MVLSRSQDVEALRHLVTTIFGLPDYSDLHKAFAEEIRGIMDVCTLDRHEIETLSYTDGQKSHQVTSYQRKLVIIFQDYLIGDPVGNDFIGISKEQFDGCRINPDCTAAKDADGKVNFGKSGTKPAGNMSSNPTSNTQAISTNAAENLQRSRKKDQTTLPTLKDEHFHESCHREFVNQCRAQGVSEIVDRNSTTMLIVTTMIALTQIYDLTNSQRNQMIMPGELI